MTIADLRIGLNLAAAPFHAGLKAATAGLRQFQVNIAGTYLHLGRFSLRVGPGAAGLIALGTGLVEVGKQAVSTAAEFEKIETAFEVMTGSAERAKGVLEGVYQFAAATPFEVKDVLKATQMFTAVGIEAETALEMVKRLGNVAAAMPEDMAQNLERVVRALADMHAKGKVQAEEMTRQLANAGIPAWEALANRIGVSVPEAIERAKAGMVSAREGIMAILDLANSPRFADMQARQAQTLIGLWSTFKDNLTFLLRDVGNLIIKGFDLKGAVGSLSAFFALIRDRLGGLEPLILKIGTVFRATFDVALGIMGKLVEKLAAWASGLDSSSGSLESLRGSVINFFEAAATSVVWLGQKLSGFAALVLEHVFKPILEGIGEITDALRGVREFGWGDVLKWFDWGPVLDDLLGMTEVLHGPASSGGGLDKLIKGLKELNADEAIKGVRDLFESIRRGSFSPPPTAQQRWDAIGTAIGGVAINAQQLERIALRRAFAAGMWDSGQAIGSAAAAAFVLKQEVAELGANAKKVEPFIKINFGEFGQGVADILKKSRSDFEELKDTLKEINLAFKELIPHEEMVTQLGAVVGVAGLLGSKILETKAGLDRAANRAAGKVALDALKKFGEPRDVAAMERGSQEAASVVARALNEQNRGRQGVEDQLRAMLRIEEAQLRVQEDLGRIARGLRGLFGPADVGQ